MPDSVSGSDGGNEVVVLSAKRTPIGRFLGVFKDLSAPDLGATAAKAALEAADVRADQVDLAIFGCARQAGVRPNPARQVALKAEVPVDRPAYTVNMACASGLQSIALGAQAIRAGEAEVVLVGGMESMSRVPHLLPRLRDGVASGPIDVLDAMYVDGFLCPLCHLVMGETVEDLAGERKIERARADEYAARSQQRCEESRREGRYIHEIAPVQVTAGKGKARSAKLVLWDEHPRDGVTPESLAKLQSAFRKGGQVTPGNSSGITDGAAALVLASSHWAYTRAYLPLARLGPAVAAGVEPARMGVGPVPAVRKLWERAGRGAKDYDLVELNEAFAAQVLACVDELELDESRLNVNGGAIALGHPIGCTGARIVVTLLHELARRGAKRGLATLCVSGGMGMALEVENLKAKR